MKAVVEIVKVTGLVLPRTLQTVITLGLFWRFHWVTNQVRANGGRRAGGLGMIYVYSDGDRLVISRMVTKTRVALRQVAAVDRAWFPVMGVQIDTTGRRAPTIPTWNPHGLAEYIEAAAMPAAGGAEAPRAA